MNLMVVKDMDIKIELGGYTTCIIGPTNAGKTTLLNKLCNKISNQDIFIDDVSISEYDITFLKNNIVVVFDDNYFPSDYVAEELYRYIGKLGYRVDEITKKIDKIAKYFKIEDLLDKRIELLKVEEKMLVKVLSYLIIHPKIFCMDNIIEYLTVEAQNLLFKYVKAEGIDFIYIVTNAEYLLRSDNVVVLNNYKAILCGAPQTLLEGNSILPYMGIKLPFLVDLSHNLMLYGMVDKVYKEDRKLVDKIWK